MTTFNSGARSNIILAEARSHPAERAEGVRCEIEHFPSVLAQYGLAVHRFAKEPSPIMRLPNGKHIILPDFWALKGVNWLVELKHKKPTNSGSFGLEAYRLRHMAALQEWVGNGQTVIYVIHDKSKIVDRRVLAKDFVAKSVSELLAEATRPYDGPSWVGGKMERVPIYYWPTASFHSLASLLAVEKLDGRHHA